MLKYLKGTKQTKLTLRVDYLLVVNLWIYASYNTHGDCRGHTGCMMRIGKGAVLISYIKHNLKVKSSIEWKLVGENNGLRVVL